MEYFIILMEVDMKVNLKMVQEMDMEYIIFLMEVDMKVNGKII